jgi:hypothetical protein
MMTPFSMIIRLLLANGSAMEMANGLLLGIEYLHPLKINETTFNNSYVTHHG